MEKSNLPQVKLWSRLWLSDLLGCCFTVESSPGLCPHHRKDPTSLLLLETRSSKAINLVGLGGKSSAREGEGISKGQGQYQKGLLRLFCPYALNTLSKKKKVLQFLIIPLKVGHGMEHGIPHVICPAPKHGANYPPAFNTLSLLTKPQLFYFQTHSSCSCLTVLLPHIQRPVNEHVIIYLLTSLLIFSFPASTLISSAQGGLNTCSGAELSGWSFQWAHLHQIQYSFHLKFFSHSQKIWTWAGEERFCFLDLSTSLFSLLSMLNFLVLLTRFKKYPFSVSCVLENVSSFWCYAYLVFLSQASP